MSSTFTIDSLAAAIAREENVNPAYNNPGGLSGAGDTGTSFGAGLGIYSTPQAGMSALEKQLALDASGASSVYSPDETLQQYMQTYTGGNANAGTVVGSILGVPSSTTIGAFAPSTNPQSSSASLPASASGNSSSSATSQSTSLIQTLLAKLIPGYKPNAGSNIVVDSVTVVVGLILITGAVFGFKAIQETVVSGVKSGASLAA
jgi:hypothetical protein